jgi:hypothetical protein
VENADILADDPAGAGSDADIAGGADLPPRLTID